MSRSLHPSSAGPAQRRLSPSPAPATIGDRRLPANPSQSASRQPTIDNPLLTFDDTDSHTGSEKTELERYVLNFARQSGLEDRYELLLFGARLARDKHEAMSRYRDELTRTERNLLETETDKGFWKQSKFFRATIIAASLAGMIQGWTQSVNNGTNHGMPEELGLCIKREGCAGKTADQWTFGMLNAMPLITAALFGTTLADPLQENYLGRRGSVMVSCCITIASTIGASTTHTVAELAVCRAINGIALGAKASVVPIYSAESAPTHIRGAILANWQLADAAGICLGFIVNLIIVSYVDKYKSWRILTNTVLIPTIPLLILIYLMPESPRYLMKHGKYSKALDAFTMFQTTPLLASRDFMYAHAQLDFESRLLRGTTDERGDIAQRIAGSDVNVRASGAEVFAQRPAPSDASSWTSMSSTRPDNRNPSVNYIGLTAEPRDSHQQSNSQDRSKRRAEIELANIAQRNSDVSGSYLESGGKRRIEEENPYFYHIGVTGYFKRLRELWVNKRCRRALLSAGVAMITQQFTGVNTIAFLGTTIWENSLKTDTKPTTSAIIGIFFGAAMYLGGIPAYWLSDKIGRSILLAIGLPNMAWAMLVFALLFKIPEDSPARAPLVSIFAIIFTLIYGPTAGTTPFSISAEVFPLVSREVGMAVSVAINLLGAGILVLLFPMLMHRIGETGSLVIFAGLNVIAFAIVYLFVPETRKRTLEELQFTFDLKTRWHVEYRIGYIRKHFVENWWKYLTRQPVEPPIPFYRWARITHGEESDEEE